VSKELRRAYPRQQAAADVERRAPENRELLHRPASAHHEDAPAHRVWEVAAIPERVCVGSVMRLLTEDVPVRAREMMLVRDGLYPGARKGDPDVQRRPQGDGSVTGEAAGLDPIACEQRVKV
jgi:hypothetical protein